MTPPIHPPNNFSIEVKTVVVANPIFENSFLWDFQDEPNVCKFYTWNTSVWENDKADTPPEHEYLNKDSAA